MEGSLGKWEIRSILGLQPNLITLQLCETQLQFNLFNLALFIFFIFRSVAMSAMQTVRNDIMLKSYLMELGT